MRLDAYTKIVLTVIALTLVLIACKPLAQPVGVAAEGPLAGVQFSPDTGNGGFWLFDAKTGDVWHYGGRNPEPQRFTNVAKLGSIAKVGEPLH